MKRQRAIIFPLIIVSVAFLVVSSLSAPARKGNLGSAEQAPAAQGSHTERKRDPLEVKLGIQPECFDDYETVRASTAVLPSGQWLVNICDALCMLDADRRVLWEYHVPQLLFDFVFIPATGLIYGTAADNTMFILEAASGKELMLNGRNGSAAYGVVRPYGDDICLVTDNNWGYRERNPSNRDSIKDGVTAWRGTKALWHAELPAGADLIIEGSKLLALTKSKDGVFIKEIAIPDAQSP